MSLSYNVLIITDDSKLSELIEQTLEKDLKLLNKPCHVLQKDIRAYDDKEIQIPPVDCIIHTYEKEIFEKLKKSTSKVKSLHSIYMMALLKEFDKSLIQTLQLDEINDYTICKEYPQNKLVKRISFAIIKHLIYEERKETIASLLPSKSSKQSSFKTQEFIDYIIDEFTKPAISKKVILADIIENNVPHTIQCNSEILIKILNSSIYQAMNTNHIESIIIKVSKKSGQISFTIDQNQTFHSSKEVTRNHRNPIKNDLIYNDSYQTYLDLAKALNGKFEIHHHSLTSSQMCLHIPLKTPPQRQRFYPFNMLAKVTYRLYTDSQTANSILVRQLSLMGANILDESQPNSPSFVIIFSMKRPSNDIINAIQTLRKKHPNLYIIVYSSNVKKDMLDDMTYLTPPVLSKSVLQQATLSFQLQPKSSKNQYSQHKNILLVDDDKSTLKMLRRKLEKEGFHCGTANDGEEVETKLAKNEYDAVLMDVMMPKKDGVETANEIRNSNHAYRDIPIILMSSGAVLTGSGETLEDIQVDDFIEKPIDQHSLAKKLRDLMF